MALRRMETMAHEETLRLAEIYEEHPCLYNTNLASYTNRTVREQAWKTVADALGKDVDFIKSKVDNLRTQYTREKRKIAKKKNIDPLYKARWWLMGKMHFLNDFTLPRIEESDILKREYNDPKMLSAQDYGDLEESNEELELQQIPDDNEEWNAETAADTSSSDVLYQFQYLNPHQTANMAKRQITAIPHRERKRLKTESRISGMSTHVDTQTLGHYSQHQNISSTPTVATPYTVKSSDERFCDYLCEEFRAMKDEQTKVKLRRNIMNLVYTAQLELHASQQRTEATSFQPMPSSDDSHTVSASAAISTGSD